MKNDEWTPDKMVQALEDALKDWIDDKIRDLTEKVQYYGEKLNGTPMEAAETALKFAASPEEAMGVQTFQVLGQQCHPKVFEAYMKLLGENAKLKRALEAAESNA